MAENTEIVIKEDGPKGPKNLFSLFPKCKLQFPFLKQEPEGVVVADVPRKADEGTESNIQKPVVVSFPKEKVAAPPPVAVEYEEPVTKTSNPIIFWQEGNYGKAKRSFYSGLIRACGLYLARVPKGFQKINVDFLLKFGDDMAISTTMIILE